MLLKCNLILKDYFAFICSFDICFALKQVSLTQAFLNALCGIMAYSPFTVSSPLQIDRCAVGGAAQGYNYYKIKNPLSSSASLIMDFLLCDKYMIGRVNPVRAACVFDSLIGQLVKL